MKVFKNIILIGITGVGKTTIVKYLADSLDFTFIDLDKNIEERCGVDVATIFSIEGESGFRKREADELRRTLKIEDDFILSVGGGCVLNQENRRMISSGNNLVVQLYADIDILVERLSKSLGKRPLLNHESINTNISELYNSRKEYYEQITDFKINTSKMKATQVVEEIISYIKIK